MTVIVISYHGREKKMETGDKVLEKMFASSMPRKRLSE